MRRDYFTLSVRRSTDEQPPTLVLAFDGPAEELASHVTGPAGDPIAAEDVDVACRLLGPAEDAETSCVLSLTHRLTGQYVAEVNASAGDVFELVEAAKADDEETRYRIRLERATGADVVYEKRTLLVYDDEGGLLRHHSLIPSGVEL
jgi:hypothetical protein